MTSGGVMVLVMSQKAMAARRLFELSSYEFRLLRPALPLVDG